MSDELDALRYPVGRFVPPEEVGPNELRSLIFQLVAAPADLRAAVAGLHEAQLETPYREGGWTVRQVVHHLPDSHLNGYLRHKWTLTEEQPRIKPYAEARWAELPDSRGPIEPALRLFDAVHECWTLLLTALPLGAWSRSYEHPERPERPIRLDQSLANYAWHGRHHIAHIRNLRTRMGW